MKLVFLLLLIFNTSVFAEDRKIIAIVDSGIRNTSEIKPYLCDQGLINYSTSQVFNDVIGHGTNITHIIIEKMDPKKYCIVHIKVFNVESETIDEENYRKAFVKLKELKPFLVNMSLSGNTTFQYEREGIKSLLDSGTKVVVAAGNHHFFLAKNQNCLEYPACYAFENENFYVVGNKYDFFDFYPASSSNFGPLVKYWQMGTNVTAGGIKMSGTSQAAAKQSAYLIEQDSKYDER